MIVVFEIDYVDIRPQALVRGLSRWTTASSDLDGAWQAAVAEVQRLSAAAPWGGDAAGIAFKNAYMLGDGPNIAINSGSEFVSDVGELGSQVRHAVENATGMDAEQARSVSSLLERI
ncbi:hypothetical protein [Streptosporangium sp. KLBMP 9127]|nr:hypothetical protein [Streptosporangium sp. KLBMP 9127]